MAPVPSPQQQQQQQASLKQSKETKAQKNQQKDKEVVKATGSDGKSQDGASVTSNGSGSTATGKLDQYESIESLCSALIMKALIISFSNALWLSKFGNSYLVFSTLMLDMTIFLLLDFGWQTRNTQL
jgi:hypothetical protein